MTNLIDDIEAYLATHFQPTKAHAAACDINIDQLEDLIAKGLYPGASYKVQHKFLCNSFVANEELQTDSTLYKISHRNWYEAIKQENITKEASAFDLFTTRYHAAHHAHFNREIGQIMQQLWPAIAKPPKMRDLAASWSYFKEGVYGVCTSDGLPETIFQKQYGVRFMDHVMSAPAQHAPEVEKLIRQIIDWLDGVIAPFPPHEIATSSRQRCIVNARIRFHQTDPADKLVR